MSSGAAMARVALEKTVIDIQGETIEIKDGEVQRGLQIKRTYDFPVLSTELAFERIGAVVKLNLQQLETNIDQGRRESNQFFKLTITFASLGFIVVLIGVMLLLIGQVTGGIVATISSIIPEVTALLFFNKDRELRKTIHLYHQHIVESQQLHTSIDVAETIRSPVERDKMKQEIIIKLLNQKPSS